MNFQVSEQHEPVPANDNVQVEMTHTTSTYDGDDNYFRQPCHPHVNSTSADPEYQTPSQESSLHTAASVALIPLTDEEKTNYRQQLHANQKLIAQRFHSDGVLVTPTGIEDADAESRQESSIPEPRSNTKRKPINSDNDEMHQQPRPGVQFVRHEAHDLSLDTILIHLGTGEVANNRGPPPPAAGNNSDMPSDATAVTEQYNHGRFCKKRFRVAVVTAIVCVLVMVSVVLCVVLVPGNKFASHGQGGIAESETAKATVFDPISVECGTVISQANPHVITQCRCYGKVFKVAADVNARYNLLANNFVQTVETDFQDSIESCSPQNQALVWLASGEGGSKEALLRQRYALALLFILWNGPEWKRADKWLSNADECTWYGVNCGIPRTVTRIALSSNNLMGGVAGKTSLLSSLTSLELDKNDFRNSSLPREISFLTSLKSLVLSSTGITGTIPTELFKLGNILEFFAVDNNNLSGTIPALIGELATLERWDVSKNLLTGTIPTEVGLCTNIGRFLIDKNKIHGTVPTQLGTMASLVMFSVKDNQLTGTIPTELASCAWMQILILGNNKLNGTVSSDLDSMHGLETVDISGNQISGTTPELICQRTQSEVCDGCSCNGCTCQKL